MDKPRTSQTSKTTKAATTVGHTTSKGSGGTSHAHRAPPPDALGNATAAAHSDVTTLSNLLGGSSATETQIDQAFTAARTDLENMMFAKSHKIPN